MKYCNNLPDIPFDPKFIAYPFDTQRFISYNPTGLERNYKYELLTEHDLGVHVDLILPEAYEKPEEQVNRFSQRTQSPLGDKIARQFTQSSSSRRNLNKLIYSMLMCLPLTLLLDIMGIQVNIMCVYSLLMIIAHKCPNVMYQNGQVKMMT